MTTAEKLDEYARSFSSELIAQRPDDETEDLIVLAWLAGWTRACEALTPRPAEHEQGHR